MNYHPEIVERRSRMNVDELIVVNRCKSFHFVCKRSLQVASAVWKECDGLPR